MTKNNQQFQDFLRDEVNINQSRLDRLQTSVGAVDSYLKEHLSGYQKMERKVHMRWERSSSLFMTTTSTMPISKS